jgi:hypothetical protein
MTRLLDPEIGAVLAAAATRSNFAGTPRRTPRPAPAVTRGHGLTRGRAGRNRASARVVPHGFGRSLRRWSPATRPRDRPGALASL